MVRDQRKGEARKERILEAALGVFSRRGYRDAAMDDIAGESETSKGGVYFHFPNKQTIFLALLDRMASLLMRRAESAIEAEPDPIKRIDAALLMVLRTFGDHRSLARLFLVEAMGAGREFNDKMLEVRANFAGLITRHLDDAVAAGAIPPLDTHLAGIAWFGALNEVVTHWVLTEDPEPLEHHYPALRDLLRRSIGVSGVLIEDQPTDGTNNGSW
ncbi:MAG: TetR/AcrR family transcriptional regulator [Sphaerobacteraceae bacterium]|nr:MAG: TetR/AcrR family transcriptional regulator [Sphaerobacteraceae bacterium]